MMKKFANPIQRHQQACNKDNLWIMENMKTNCPSMYSLFEEIDLSSYDNRSNVKKQKIEEQGKK